MRVSKKHTKQKLSEERLVEMQRKYEEVGINHGMIENTDIYHRWMELVNPQKRKPYTLRWVTDERELELVFKKD